MGKWDFFTDIYWPNARHSFIYSRTSVTATNLGEFGLVRQEDTTTRTSMILNEK